MNTLTKTLLGASIFSLASLGFAADSGSQTSSYDIDGGSLGSGGGSGEGTWGVSTARNGDKNFTITDSGLQETTVTKTTVDSTISLTYSAASGTWSGTSTPTKCTNVGGLFNGCSYITLNVPVELYGISASLDDNNLGTITQKSDNTAAGTTATTTVTYTLTE